MSVLNITEKDLVAILKMGYDMGWDDAIEDGYGDAIEERNFEDMIENYLINGQI